MAGKFTLPPGPTRVVEVDVEVVGARRGIVVGVVEEWRDSPTAPARRCGWPPPARWSSAQSACWFTSAWRSMESAMARRMSGEKRAGRPAGHLQLQEGARQVDLALDARAARSSRSRKPGVRVAGQGHLDVARAHPLGQLRRCSTAMCTVMLPRVRCRAPPLRVVAQGRCVWADTLAISNGPPERSMAGFDRGARRVPPRLLHDVGRQQVGEEHLPVGEGSVEDHRDRAALVAPRYRRDVPVPAVLATVAGSDVRSPRCCVQA